MERTYGTKDTLGIMMVDPAFADKGAYSGTKSILLSRASKLTTLT